jgi:two-component system response regulator YesN
MFRVLIADDEPRQIKRLGSLIAESGLPFEVCGSAGDGRRAERMVADLQPDLLISDIRMPFRDGLEVTELLKRERPDLPVVLISAFQDFEYVQRGLRMGILDYLLKPVGIDDVRRVLGRAEELLVESRRNMLRRSLFRSSPVPESRMATLLADLAPYRLALYLNQPGSGPGLSTLLCREGIGVSHAFLDLEDRGDGSRLFLITEESDASAEAEGPQMENGVLILSELNPVYADWDELSRKMTRRLWESGRWGKNALVKIGEGEKHLTADLFSPDEERRLRERLQRKGGEERFFDLLEDILKREAENHIPLIVLIEGLRRLERLMGEGFAVRRNIPVSLIRLRIEELVQDLHRLGFSPEGISGELKRRIMTLKSESDGDSLRLELVKDYIDRNFFKNIDSSYLADMWGVSTTLLNGRFKAEYGLSPTKYLISVRIEAAGKLLLTRPEMQIKEIARETGYDDPLYFSRIFHKKTGFYPSEFRERQGETKQVCR